ncbi:MAG: hypothetical protein NTU47_09705 [Ignavibacteriales bacterium]|nr:hypothetical protein [Ignavibacteriales bacterium]
MDQRQGWTQTLFKALIIGEAFEKLHRSFLNNGNITRVMQTLQNPWSNIKCARDPVPPSEQDTVRSFSPICNSFERIAGHEPVTACGTTVAEVERTETVSDNLSAAWPTAMPRLRDCLTGSAQG